MQRTPKLTWIGGAFFFDDHNEGQVEITRLSQRIQIRPFAKIGDKAGALFGQATYQPVEPRVADGRESGTRTSRRISTTPAGRTGSGTDILANPASFYDFVDSATYRRLDAQGQHPGARRRATRSSTSPRREASRAADSTPPRTEPGRAFSPEFAWSYEGGLKRTMAGGRVRANTAVFYNDYQDLQVQSFLRPGVPDISNAASATIKGVEIEVAAAPGRGRAARGPRLVARRDL